MPDELTVAHMWRDEKKPREYAFDGVFGPDASQEQVRGGWGVWVGWGWPWLAQGWGGSCGQPSGPNPSQRQARSRLHLGVCARNWRVRAVLASANQACLHQTATAPFEQPRLPVSPRPPPGPTPPRPSPTSRSPQVFEDTRHLVQSAVDGFNVCIWAYGQTGSGKTHTIYGSKPAPGLTPRGVGELFRILERASGRISASVTLYMLELYQARGAGGGGCGKQGRNEGTDGVGPGMDAALGGCGARPGLDGSLGGLLRITAGASLAGMRWSNCSPSPGPPPALSPARTP